VTTFLIGTFMKMDQEIGIQTSNYAAPIAHVIDRDFDLLRAHARERSIWAVRMQRVQDIVTTAMAIVLGTVMGWLLLR
jgi:heme O synthase-like polyprenyltransferase